MWERATRISPLGQDSQVVMSLHGEMSRTAPSSSSGDFASLELLQAHACPYFYLLVKHFPTKQPSRWGLEVEVSLNSPLLASTGKELRGCPSPGQVRECHLRGYSPASSFHLLYLFNVAGFHSSNPLLALLWVCFLYWLIYTPAEITRGERRCLKPGKSERSYREERHQS